MPMCLFCFPLLKGHLDKCHLPFKSQHSAQKTPLSQQPQKPSFVSRGAHLVTRMQLWKRLSRQKKSWRWSQKINFINLLSTYSQDKEDKRILANVISSFPLVNPDDAVRIPGLFPGTCGTSQDLTRRFFWPTDSRFLRDYRSSPKIINGNKHFLNALSNLLVLPTRGSGKDVKLIFVGSFSLSAP